MKVGVLALQGDVGPHRETFAELGIDAREVRRPAELDGLSHLVLPGGESTALHHLLELFGLRAAILRRYRARHLALFGTCAGAILLGRGDGERPPRFGLLDAVVSRNAYGRQVDSFAKPINCDVFGRDIRCVFIRAPKFTAVGPKARVLARDGGDPILVEGPGLLAATFHPELAGTAIVHRYFLRPQLWRAACRAEFPCQLTPEVARA